MHFILLYRPPSSGVDNMEKLCEVLRRLQRDTIVIGDFNLPGIDWGDLSADSKGRHLAETVGEEDLDQLVSFPTHTKGNVLDLVITNCGHRVLSITDEGRLGRSDHILLNIEIEMEPRKPLLEGKRLVWSRADWDEMRKMLRQNERFQSKTQYSINEEWINFTENLDKIISKNVPTARIKSKQQPKWMNRDLLRLIREKRNAWRSFKNYGTIESSEKYKKLEREVVKRIRNAKRKLEKEIANSSGKNIKKFTDYIKAKTKSKTSIGPLKDSSGSILTEDKEVADHLNNFFTSVFTKDDGRIIPVIVPETDDRLETVEITGTKIRKVIRNLRAGSAPGPDGITPLLLKNLCEELIGPLQRIFNRSIIDGAVPNGWKEAVVVPIFKKGLKSEACNYRPVSLTSVPCKILETIVKEDIMIHLERNHLIKKSQHGFMRGRSCATNLIEFMDRLTKIIDRGSNADLFYLDFAKAFDKVSHRLLLAKLKAKGVDGKLLAWIAGWLLGRKQRVKVGTSISDPSDVDSGIPQGTVLGPPLFIIYIDDIDEAVAELDLIMKFADDTKGLQEIRNDGDRIKLQNTLDRLVEWASKWAMEFNTKKCKIIHVGNRNPGYKYVLNGEELHEVDEEKDIGVLVHKNLKPSKQCQRAAATASAVLRQIAKNFHYRDRRTFRKLYCQYVRPHLEFSTPAWSPWLATDIDVLENVQKRAVNMMVGLTGSTYEEKCAEVNLDILTVRRKMADLIQVYKYIHAEDQSVTNEMFEKVTVRGAETRQSSDPLNLRQPRARLDIRKYGFTSRVVHDWNSLPPEIKNKRTLHQFKQSLKLLYRRPVVGAAAE